jgi:hypothetical protein
MLVRLQVRKEMSESDLHVSSVGKLAIFPCSKASEEQAKVIWPRDARMRNIQSFAGLKMAWVRN